MKNRRAAAFTSIVMFRCAHQHSGRSARNPYDDQPNADARISVHAGARRSGDT